MEENIDGDTELPESMVFIVVDEIRFKDRPDLNDYAVAKLPYALAQYSSEAYFSFSNDDFSRFMWVVHPQYATPAELIRRNREVAEVEDWAKSMNSVDCETKKLLVKIHQEVLSLAEELRELSADGVMLHGITPTDVEKEGSGAADSAGEPKKNESKEQLLISTLSKHHKYEIDSIENYDPIGCTELAKRTEAAKSTVSDFFRKHFGSHRQYKFACQNDYGLLGKLRSLNGDELMQHRSSVDVAGL